MRLREDIEQEYYKEKYPSLDLLRKLNLEILLDIRDLLKKLK